MVSKLQFLAPKTLVKYLKQHGIVLVSINKIKTMSKKHPLPIRIVLVACAVFLVVASFGTPLVRAVQCSTVSECSVQQQAAIDQKNQNLATLSQLQVQAGSYQEAVYRLQNQLNGLQQQIQINQDQQIKLQQQIADEQAQIDLKKQQLGATIKSMYMDGQASTIEELATSKNLSDYVDKQTYRQIVQNQLNSMIKQIQDLQTQLKDKKVQTDALLASEKTQNDQLASDRYQQSQLLGYNTSQQTQYNQQIQANQTLINQIKAKIAELNTPAGSLAITGGRCGGGYPQSTLNALGQPWGCNYSKDYPYDPYNSVYNSYSDNWGLYNRECVSYTAFKVHEDYLLGINTRDMPSWGGVGNAYEWIDNARNAGILVDQTPTEHSIAIRPIYSNYWGDVGHAMYVESVNSDGTINVSQYNADLRGNYSTVSHRSVAGLYFLHFDR